MAVSATDLASRRAGTYVPGRRQPPPAAPETPPWTPPDYAGTDPAYLAWLANARLRGTNVISDARMRHSQAEESYRQALEDLDYQATSGRRTLQGGMLGRGIFRSGETDRRKTEFDAAIEQGRQRATTAQTDQFGAIDADQRNALAALGMEGTQQVSQAMLRDALAAYNATQAAATPSPTYAGGGAAAAYTAPSPATGSGSPSYVRPTTNQSGLDPRYRVPAAPAKPKPPSGTTGQLKQKKSGLQ